MRSNATRFERLQTNWDDTRHRQDADLDRADCHADVAVPSLVAPIRLEPLKSCRVATHESLHSPRPHGTGAGAIQYATRPAGPAQPSYAGLRMISDSSHKGAPSAEFMPTCPEPAPARNHHPGSVLFWTAVSGLPARASARAEASSGRDKLDSDFAFA